MIRIAIVEDEKEVAQTLMSYIDTYTKQKKIEVKTKWFNSAESLFQDYPKGLHLIFMDIELLGMDGMTAAKKLREKNEEVSIIFVTNLSQYAIQGYEVQAFDFIVKPLQYYTFLMKFNRFLSFHNMSGKEIWLSMREEKRAINSDKIIYIEVMKHMLTYHMANGEEISCSGTLSSIREQLQGYSFVQCNRSCLVNLQYVKHIKGYDLYIEPDGVLQISRDIRKKFLEQMNNYLSFGGKLQ